MNRLRHVLTLLVAAACALVLVPVAPADAAAAPRVTLSPRHTRITATGTATFDFHAHHLRSGSRVTLQIRRKATWTTLGRTGTRRGTFAGTFHVAGPGAPGAFAYRAAVVRSGHVRAASGGHRVYSYGAVTLGALCHGVLDGDCEAGSEQLADGSSFHYALLTGINETSDPFTSQLGAAKTSCRSIRLRYLSDSPDSTTTYLTLRQPGHPTQKHSSSSAVVGTFDATLTGGRFDLDVEQDAAQVFMYFAGSASCWTATGAR